MKSWSIYLSLPLLLFMGCEYGSEDISNLTDSELIQMIIDADKTAIGLEELPGQSIMYLANDIEYDGVGAQMANGLGYEVAIAGNGYRCGLRNEVYFNLEGRRLNPNDMSDKRGWDRDGRDHIEEDWECFELVFPVTFEMPDGSTFIVTSNDEEGWSDIKHWYDENEDTDQRPEMLFPINILIDEELITINNNSELIGVYSQCRPDYYRDEYYYGKEDWECFELVFPVTFEMPDGSTFTVTSDDEEGWSDIKDWYDENNSEEKPLLHYPVNIVFDYEEGNVTINNDEEMREAEAACREWDDVDSEWDCFEIVLPVTIIMPDGSTMIIEDEEEGWMQIDSWYEDNDFEEEPTLQYPVDILYDDEEGQITVTINSDEEWRQAEEACFEQFERP